MPQPEKKTELFKVDVQFFCGSILLLMLGAHAAALPPDPNNAALLYYQAFILRPKPDTVAEELVYNTPPEKIYKLLRGGKLEPDPEEEIPKIEDSIHKLEERIKNYGVDPNEMPDIEMRLRKEQEISADLLFAKKCFDDIGHLKALRKYYEMMRGVDPNKNIRFYLRECRQTIDVAQAASEISECNWGYLYLPGFGSFATQLSIETRNLGVILRADALLLAADGDYQAAFERCLMMRRFARHLDDDSSGVSDSLPVAMEAYALRCMRCVLDTMPQNEETLRWLRDQLATEPPVSEPLSMLIKQNLERYFWAISKEASRYFSRLGQKLTEQAANDKVKKEALNLTYEELLRLIREPYDKFVSSLDVLASDMPYEKKYTRIKSMTNELIEQINELIEQTKQTKDSSAITWYIKTLGDSTYHFYGLHVAHTSQINAVKAAVEIYLIKAKTGQLPQTLPDGLPKDPFSGKDFEYERTEEGFVLRCRGKDIHVNIFRQYEFKVQKEGQTEAQP